MKKRISIIEITNTLDDYYQSKYPTHGWLRTNQGLKVVYLPVLDLLDHQKINDIRQNFNFKTIDPRDYQDLLGFIKKSSLTLKNINTLLTEIARFNRLIGEIPLDPGKHSDRQINDLYYYTLQASFYLELFLIYLKRFADLISKILIFLIFDDYLLYDKIDSFKKLLDKIAKSKVRSLNNVFKNNNLIWFNSIAPKRGRGFRNILEHHADWIIPSIHQIGNGKPQITFDIYNPYTIKNKPINIQEISLNIDRIKSIISNFCLFLTELTKYFLSSNENGRYNFANCLLPQLPEYRADDAIYFWPEIN